YFRSMKAVTFIVSGWFLLSSSYAGGQCPNKDSMWNRISYLSANAPPEKQLEEVLAYLDKIKACPDPNDSTHVYLLLKAGIIYYGQSAFLKATDYFKQAARIISANIHKPSIKPKQLISCYYWLSEFYDSLKDTYEKMKAVDSCISVAQRLNA